ncbi:MAG: WD40 repeat domain-containing protein [Cytophagales bacterium]|nr:WD40 repeat domain-containing protein [Cytophagales bacterium]
MVIQVNRLHVFTGHHDCVYTLAPAHHHAQFFSGGGDGMVVQWDLTQPNQGELIAQLPNSVYALHADTHHQQLLVGHNYDGIHVLDWQTKRELASLQLTAAAIFDIATFESDILVATGEGMLVVVDRATLRIKKKLAPSEKSARVMAINPRAGEVAVGFSDNFIRVFSLQDFKLKFEWQAHQNSVFALAYTPDFNFLISGSRDARLKAWDVTSAYGKAEEVAAHLFAINHLAFHPSGKYFATASMDKSIKVWQTADMKLLKVIDKARHAGHGTSVNKLIWSAHHDQLISASDDRTISVWKIHLP